GSFTRRPSQSREPVLRISRSDPWVPAFAGTRLFIHRALCESSASSALEGSLSSLSNLWEPEGEATGGFGDVLGRAGEGEADPAVAVERIEIAPRGYRDADLGEHALTEFDAVAGQ